MPASASDSRDVQARGEAYRVLFGAPSTWGRSTGQRQRRKPAFRRSVVMNADRETSASNPSGTPGVHHEVSRMFARVRYRALRYCSRGIPSVRCSALLCVLFRNINIEIQFHWVTLNPLVAGSNPTRPTKVLFLKRSYVAIYITFRRHSGRAGTRPVRREIPPQRDSVRKTAIT
jgi:hypothetical protein